MKLASPLSGLPQSSSTSEDCPLLFLCVYYDMCECGEVQRDTET